MTIVLFCSCWRWWNLAAQHHYISKFHLNLFLDPDSLENP
jgi:hypothetical protein